MDFLDKAFGSLKDLFLEIPIVKRTVKYMQSIPTHMDFEGQRKAEKLYQVIITVFGIVGFVYGFIVEQFSHTVLFLGVGFIFSCLLVLPPWPFFRRNPLQWQKKEQLPPDSADSSVKTKVKEQTKKKKTQ